MLLSCFSCVDRKDGGKETSNEETTTDKGGDGTTVGGDDTTVGGDDTTVGGDDTTAGGNDTTTKPNGGNGTTNPPVTNPPVTNPPVTNPPVTNPPVTDPPVTEPPVTEPPVTEPPIAGTRYELDLSIDKTISGPFRYAGYKLSDGKLYELSSTANPTWSEDYPGHHVLLAPDAYVVSKPEHGGVVDLMAQTSYGAAVVFTAPVSGTATVVGEVKKLYNPGNMIDITVMTADGRVVYSKKGIKSAGTVSFSAEVELAALESVFLLVTYSEGNIYYGAQNCALYSFDVYLDKHEVTRTDNIPSKVSDSNITTWLTHSYDKIVVGTSGSQSTGNTTYTVSMAKRETEGCQLVVYNTSSSSRSYSVKLVSSPDPTISFSTYVLDTYATFNGSNYTDACKPYSGTAVSVSKSTQVPFLIEFTTSGTTPAGDHTFTFAVINDKGQAVALHEITVNVWNFELPTEKTFGTAAGLHMWYACVLEEVDEYSSDFRSLYNSYYNILLEHNMSAYTFPVDILSIEADAYLNDPLITYVEVPSKDSSGNLLSEEQLLKYYKKLKSNPDWLAKAAFYPIDEPDSVEDIDKYNEICEYLNTVCPDIPVIIPFYTNIRYSGVTDQVAAMAENTTLWCPKLCLWDDSNAYSDYTGMWSFFKPSKSFAERMAEYQTSGDGLWTYVCNDPDDPYSQMFVDTLGVNQRLLFWQIYRRNIEGFLYWSVTSWRTVSDWTTVSPWDTLYMGYGDANGNPVCGEGILLYPGKEVGVDGPVASIRLKIVRDGIDDIELMYLAEKYLGEDWVMSKVNSATSSLTTFTDNDSFAALRKEIGDALENAK